MYTARRGPGPRVVPCEVMGTNVSEENRPGATPATSRAKEGRRKGGARSLEKPGGGRGSWVKWTGGILAAVVILPILGFMVAYLLADVPEPEELTSAQVSQIYAADNETELARIVPPDGNRRQVALEEIPQGVQDAVLAAEDREFWTNPGFSITGFGRAVLGQITGDASAGGGSTITQQYVKNALVGNEHSLARKARELVYSTKMANEWTKEEVLAAYLNTVYFGRNAYGVEAAANAYFDKHVSDLTSEEGAVLAAAIQRPSELDPWVNREESEARWNYVMDGMVESGTIPAEQRAAAVYPEVQDPANYSAYTEASGPNGMIKNQVISELETVGLTEEDVTTRGLRVTTTIDPQAQQAALDAVYGNMEGAAESLRTAVVSVDPRSGAVRAYYGGEDPSGWDYANAGLQTGSTFKIFGLAAALQQGIPLSAAYSSEPVTLPGGIPVGNVGGESCGTCSISEALKRSLNTSFIRLQDDLENKTQDTADMAHALGVARSIPGVPETLTENGQTPYEGIVLGQYQSRPLDMAVALGTLTNRGVWQQPHFVSKVETATGEVLYEFEDKGGERRVNETVADNVIQAMQPIAAYSNGHVLANGRPSAAKTGTTQLGDTGSNKDAWMVGSTPQLSTAVWVGTVDNSPIYMYGSGMPSDIWKSTMDGALQNQEIESFPQAKPVTWGEGNYNTAYTPPATQADTGSATPTSEAPSPEATEPEPAPEPGPAPEPVPGGDPNGDQPAPPELPELEVPEELLPF